MGTDGLFDNLHDSEIKACALSVMNNHHNNNNNNNNHSTNPTTLAILLSRQLCYFAARRAGDSSSRSTPYALAASEAFDMAFNGGKMDDITVLVVIVTEK